VIFSALSDNSKAAIVSIFLPPPNMSLNNYALKF